MHLIFTIFLICAPNLKYWKYFMQFLNTILRHVLLFVGRTPKRNFQSVIYDDEGLELNIKWKWSSLHLIPPSISMYPEGLPRQKYLLSSVFIFTTVEMFHCFWRRRLNNNKKYVLFSEYRNNPSRFCFFPFFFLSSMKEMAEKIPKNRCGVSSKNKRGWFLARVSFVPPQTDENYYIILHSSEAYFVLYFFFFSVVIKYFCYYNTYNFFF